MQGSALVCPPPSLRHNSRSMAPSAFPQHRFLPDSPFASVHNQYYHLHNHPCRRSARLASPAASLTPILASPLSTPASSIHDHHDMASYVVPDTLSIPPPIWTETPPTPPPASLSHRPCSLHVSPCPKNPLDPSVVVKRRASLPPSLVSKPLPPIPVSTHPGLNTSLSASSNRRYDTSRPRPLFHIGPDVPEKEGPDQQDDTTHSSSSAGRVSKENSRRCHVLSELLSTELGYLIDLRILVCVYLRLLPILVTRSASASTHTSSSNLSSAPFSRTPSLLGISYLGGSSRAPSSQYITGAKPLSSTQPTDCDAHNLLIFQPLPLSKDKDKNSPRHLFSPSDLDIVTRNADQILELHENLVRRLRTAVSQFGFPMKWDNEDALDQSAHPADLQRAIDAVSNIFIEQASSFDRYRSFCSGHPDALNAMHKVQQKFPSEWEAFEQRCADIAAEMLTEVSPHSPRRTKPDNQQGFPVPLDTASMSSSNKRRHSLSSLDASARAQVLPHVLSSFHLRTPNISASESGHSANATGIRRPRLLFVDYLIKPVQRICKYPLLLGQLQLATPDPERGIGPCHEVIERAAHVMRTVTSSVDEARRQQELAVKTSLIVSRICQGASACTTNPCSQPLTPGFLLSLGCCQTAGSLDVIHYHGSNLGNQGTVKAKYLGAFLFTGGFLVLAKVAKPKAYEPKHWFSLKGFELADSNTDEALLSSWFRLSFRGHTFELAASCRREKDVWMDAMRSALSEELTWDGELPTSFYGDGRTDMVIEDVPFEIIAPLPTIQSIPEFENDTNFSTTGEAPYNPADVLSSCRANHRVDYTTKLDTASRRASMVPCKVHQTSSVESGTFHLVRSTTLAREQVERDLLDVFSEKLLSARCQASALEEDLFEGRTVARSFSRSSSGLTMASAMSVAAMNRLTRRESVLVPRRASFIDVGNNSSLDVEACGLISRPNRPARKRRQPKKLNVIMAKPVGSEEESPSPVSHCSSTSVTALATPLDSPSLITTNLPGLDNGIAHRDSFKLHQQGCTPKRSRSMIENVRGLFVPRSASPASVLVRESSVGSGMSSKGLFKWWSRETFRHRSRSAPDTPGDQLPTSKSLGPEIRHPSILIGDRSYSSQSDLKRLSLPSHRRGSSTPAQGHVRHSSVDFELGYQGPAKGKSFSTRSRRASMSITAGLRDREGECAAGASSSKLRRSLSFFQRLTPMGT
ncbi:hypothetical protein EDC04DRAFT_2623368 [Pisolithus marmoratus]|nr:hypothetical protein EDC04DRAFT_2623368 [Pisolithus marmoratus]